jgi:hypothetical protein
MYTSLLRNYSTLTTVLTQIWCQNISWTTSGHVGIYRGGYQWQTGTLLCGQHHAPPDISKPLLATSLWLYALFLGQTWNCNLHAGICLFCLHLLLSCATRTRERKREREKSRLLPIFPFCFPSIKFLMSCRYKLLRYRMSTHGEGKWAK